MDDQTTTQGTVTSPRLRGEVDARSVSGEGVSRQAAFAGSPPHPNPLPAGGEREREAGPNWKIENTFWARNENVLLGTISMLAFLAFWEVAVAASWVNPLFTSSPSRIVLAGL